VSAGRKWLRWRKRRGGRPVDPVWLRQYLSGHFRQMLAGPIGRCLADDPAETALLLDDVVDFYLAELAAGRLPLWTENGIAGRNAFLRRWLVGFPERMRAREAAAAGPGAAPTQ
jgi:hypothetical protein